MKVELRNVKRLEALSEETDCFSAMVVIDGKVAGVVTNAGHGGPNDYGFNTKELSAYCKTLPPLVVPKEWGLTKPLDMDVDLLIGELLNVWEEKRRIKNACKKHLVFRLIGDEEGSFRTVNQPYSARTKEWLVGKFGDKVERIYNDGF